MSHGRLPANCDERKVHEICDYPAFEGNSRCLAQEECWFSIVSHRMNLLIGVFWLGGPEEKISVWICIKPNLVFSHFGWVGGWYRGQKFSVRICIKPNLAFSHFGWVGSRKKVQSKFVSSQIWCYLSLGGWSQEINCGPNLYQAKCYVISFLEGAEGL